jgi:hypothetical protein
MTRKNRWLRSLRALAMTTLALALMVFCFGIPFTAQAQSQETIIAQALGTQLPAGDLFFRFNATPVPANVPGVTHTHLSGFDYSRVGTHVQVTAGREKVLSVGQAAYIETGQEHTHMSSGGSAFTFWFIAVRPEATRGAPPVWPYPGARIVGETEKFQLPYAGPWDQLLTEVQLRPGETVGSLSTAGPAGLIVLEGAVSIGGTVLTAEGTTLQPWGDARTLTNTGAGTTRLIVLHVVPRGKVPVLPGGNEPLTVRRLGDG